MTAIETLAALLVVVNVALLARRSVWNYPFGIAGVLVYAAVFFRARLYSDTLLQGFFLVLNVYGWITWQRSRALAGEVVVERMTGEARAIWLAGSAAAALGWGTAMHRFTDAAYPWWDAGIAAASVAAQLLLAGRKLENWLLWIAIDIASIGLYAAKALWPTVILYVLLLFLAVIGLRDWLAAERPRRAGAIA